MYMDRARGSERRHILKKKELEAVEGAPRRENALLNYVIHWRWKSSVDPRPQGPAHTHRVKIVERLRPKLF